MRRALIAVPLVLLALIAALGLWGVTLPREHHASSRVTIAAPPESVYTVMRDQGALPAWWSEVQSITNVPGTDGWERWKEKMGGAEFTLIVTEEEPGVRFVTQIDTAGGVAFGGTWLHETALAAGSGTTVTITENGWIGNPFFRVGMKLMGDNSTLDSYLTALGAKFGQTVTPTHVIP
jgi:uncharacterized protein YndB with AHSA1/START domain